MVGVSHSTIHALKGKINGNTKRLEGAKATHQCANCTGGVDVTCTMECTGEALVKILEVLVTLAVVGIDTYLVILKAYASKSGSLGAKVGEFLEHQTNIILGVVGVVRNVEHKGCLGEIGNNQISARAKFCHFPRKLGGKALVKRAIVRHYGVDDYLTREGIHKGIYKLELAEGTEIACVYSIKIYRKVGKSISNGLYLICQVAESKLVKGGMSRQNRGG